MRLNQSLNDELIYVARDSISCCLLGSGIESNGPPSFNSGGITGC